MRTALLPATRRTRLHNITAWRQPPSLHHTRFFATVLEPSSSTPNPPPHQTTAQQPSQPQPHPPKTALFFPGQGVQRIGMLTSWLSAFPQTVKPIMDEVDSILSTPLTTIIQDGPTSALNHTENAQPAIMATSLVVLRCLETHFGLSVPNRISHVLGHSLGEFAALVAGNYMSFADALRMVRTRGEVMAKCSAQARAQGGEVGMVALICEPAHLQSLIDAIHEFVGYGSLGYKSDAAESHPEAVQQVLIANINAKNQVVLSGTISRIKTLLTNLREFGGHDPRAVQLKSESPFHSPLMEPAAEAMRRILRKPGEDGEDVIRFPGTMPCVSNVSARPFKSREEMKELLARSCVETVLWWDSIKYLDQEVRVRRWIGLGPGKVGRNLVGKEVGMKGAVKGGGVWGVSDPREAEEAMKGLEATDSARRRSAIEERTASN